MSEQEYQPSNDQTAKTVSPSPIPGNTLLDSSLALLSEGYTFISRRCERYQTDIFTTRLILQKALCVMGEDAARMFYTPGRFTRKNAMPPTTLRLLQDKGSVQLQSGDAHRWRKQMFMALMTPAHIQQLTDLFSEQWRAAFQKWQHMEEVVLFPEVREILCRAVCAWAGVPLAEVEVKQRTREFGAMIDYAGSVGPKQVWAQLLRARTERWIGEIIEQVRSHKLVVPEESAAHVVAWHQDQDGNLLDTEVATVELINLLRPTVAVTRYVVFAALAVHEHPEYRHRLQTGDDSDLEMFVQEVRRYYPFFPFIGGRARHEFSWRGYTFAKGTWVLLDLYGTNHDPRIWQEPQTFQPERFRHWDGSAFSFIPQGGGDHSADHRCPGEWITIEIMKEALRMLTQAMIYSVPPQDLSISLSKLPAIPQSRFVISNVQGISHSLNG